MWCQSSFGRWTRSFPNTYVPIKPSKLFSLTFDAVNLSDRPSHTAQGGGGSLHTLHRVHTLHTLNTLHIHCTYITHTVQKHYTYIAHTLHIHYIYTTHTLYTNPPAPKVLGRDRPDGTRKRLQVYLGGGIFRPKPPVFDRS